MNIEQIVPQWAIDEANKVTERAASSGGRLRDSIAYSLLMTQRRTAGECIRLADDGTSRDQISCDQIRLCFLSDD